LLFQRKNPSWLYSVDQGATTIWERWNSYRKDTGFGPVGMNSFNHYAYGAVLAWIYKTAAGIAADPSDPGFKTVIMAPVPDKRLGFVEAEYKSAAGLIKSAWRYEGEKWIWNFTVPEGSRAMVKAPGDDGFTEYKAGVYEIVR
jgi:alpha-L-rhamnosidase